MSVPVFTYVLLEILLETIKVEDISININNLFSGIAVVINTFVILHYIYIIKFKKIFLKISKKKLKNKSKSKLKSNIIIKVREKKKVNFIFNLIFFIFFFKYLNLN